MSVPLKGKELPEMGKSLPKERKRRQPASAAVRIAQSLNQELKGSRRAIKTVMKWTGASERTVKGWLAGTSAPRCEHLILLASHSDLVFEQFLDMSDRNRVETGVDLSSLRNKLAIAVDAIDAVEAVRGKS